MNTPLNRPLVTKEHMDRICKAIPLKDAESRKYLEEEVSFGVNHYRGEDDYFAGAGCHM